jgi:hypothetical protein
VNDLRDPVGETVFTIGLILAVMVLVAGLLAPWWWTP